MNITNSLNFEKKQYITGNFPENQGNFVTKKKGVAKKYPLARYLNTLYHMFEFLCKCLYQVWAIAVFPVFRLLTDFVCLLPFPWEDCSVFDNFVITLIFNQKVNVSRSMSSKSWFNR